MSKLKLYIREKCPFCMKVLDYMDENDLEDIEVIDISKDEMSEKELEEKGAKNQVPCLKIDDRYMYESVDIIEYLKENK